MYPTAVGYVDIKLFQHLITYGVVNIINIHQARFMST